jgi:hypothetical protein
MYATAVQFYITVLLGEQDIKYSFTDSSCILKLPIEIDMLTMESLLMHIFTPNASKAHALN